jgi:hypothetical protein
MVALCLFITISLYHHCTVLFWYFALNWLASHCTSGFTSSFSHTGCTGPLNQAVSLRQPMLGFCHYLLCPQSFQKSLEGSWPTFIFGISQNVPEGRKPWCFSKESMCIHPHPPGHTTICTDSPMLPVVPYNIKLFNCWTSHIRFCVLLIISWVESMAVELKHQILSDMNHEPSHHSSQHPNDILSIKVLATVKLDLNDYLTQKCWNM